MFKSIHNIRSAKKRLLLFVTFLLSMVTVFSQNVDSVTSVIADTTVVNKNDYPDPDETPPVFDSLNLFNIPSYTTYDIDDSIIQNLKKDEAFWYVDKAPKRQKPPEFDPNKKYSEPFYLQTWFRVLLWIIIVGAFIAVLIWFLVASDIKLFRKKAKVLFPPEEIATNEDIFSINYEEELSKAVSDKNYRLGVRLMYLHILRLFSEKSIIHYKIERTNSDYLLQLVNTSYYKEFFRLTRNFEYVWYGKFDISAAAFEIIQQDHTKLKSQL